MTDKTKKAFNNAIASARYVSLSNGIEYKVKGQDYSILEKGDSVNVVYHDVTGCITGEHYKWSDMG